MRRVSRRSRAAVHSPEMLKLPSVAQIRSGALLDWKTAFLNTLPIYGHRNWIVVADSAFPAFTEPGIETVVVDDSLPSVLEHVAGAITSSGHVRATAFQDQELQFIDESDYSGVSDLRRQIAETFPEGHVSSIPHAELMTRIREDGKTYRVLFIKTKERIPYSSIYIRLDCGYMSEEVERRIGAAAAAAVARQLK